MRNTIFQWRVLHILNRISPDPDDKRYPRKWWFRVLRGILRPWWLIFVLYLTGVIFNLITLTAQYNLTALLNFSKVTQALLLSRLVPNLEERPWAAIPWIVIVVFLILLGYLAHRDRQVENTVLTLREDQKRHSNIQDEFENQISKTNHPVKANGIGNIASSGPVINSPISNTFNTYNFNLKDKRSLSFEAQAVSIERTQFEAYTKADPKRQSLIRDEATFYVEPTLLWQQDMDRNQNLRDPDARDAWLQIIGKLPSVSLTEVVNHNRVLIIGEFNVGKTLLLEHLRGVALQQDQAKIEESNNTSSEYYLPILLPLRYYQNASETFLAYIQHIFREIYCDISRTSALEIMPTDAVLRSGSYTFLFDGLDELGGSQRMELLKNIQYFISQYPQHKYIFSSRQLAYGVSETVFANVEHEILLITPFSRQQIQLYIKKRGLAETPLEETFRQRRDLQAIARIPGTLKALCDIGGIPGNLPLSLSTIYERLITTLLDNEVRRGTAVIEQRGLTRLVLNKVALELTATRRYSLSEKDLEVLILHIIQEMGLTEGFQVRQWIDEIRHREILISEGKEVSFQHRSWQEYLTACTLVEEPLEHILELIYVVRKRASGFNPLWYQVLRFLCERRLDLLDAIYQREEITGARCTPLDGDDNRRMQALRTIFSTYARQETGLPGSFGASRDIFNDQQTCMDLNPSDGATYLIEQYSNVGATLAVKYDAFSLLVSYAANNNAEAREFVTNLEPALLSIDEADWGQREIAAYAVSELSLRQFVPQLLSIYEVEKNKHVCRAILSSLSKLAPEARQFFSDLLMHRLESRSMDTINDSVLIEAVQRLLDEPMVCAIRDHLRIVTSELPEVPEGLIDLLIKHDTQASREALLILITRSPLLSGSTDRRDAINESLAHDRIDSVCYLLENAAGADVDPLAVVDTLVVLLDETTLAPCKDKLISTVFPDWIVKLTYQSLVSSGKKSIAEHIANYRGDTLPEPAPAAVQPVRPVQQTLEDLLSQSGWQQGKAFGLQAEYYIRQVDTLPPERRQQLQEHVVEYLNNLDFKQAFSQIDEHNFTISTHAAACLAYAATLKIEVSPNLYSKLLSVNFDDPSILTLCEQNYSPDKDEEIIKQFRAGAPHACLLRASVLCANDRRVIRPLQVVPALGEVIQELCSEKESHYPLHLNLVYSLIQTLSRYGAVGTTELDRLIEQVDNDWAYYLAKARIPLTPPSSLAEIVYLGHLIAQVTKGDIHFGDQEVQYLQTPKSVPLLYELSNILLKAQKEPVVSSSDEIDFQSDLTVAAGVIDNQTKISAMLATIFAVLIRIATDDVIEGYENLMENFPDKHWLWRYYNDARQVYLAS
jgi:hypothetical protein